VQKGRKKSNKIKNKTRIEYLVGYELHSLKAKTTAKRTKTARKFKSNKMS